MDEEYRQRLTQLRQQHSTLPDATDTQRAARSIISAFLQVDTEAAALRTKAKAPSRLPAVSPEEEDFAIAMNVLEKYQAEKKQVLPSPALPKKQIAEYDPRINIEERHQLVSQKREERKAKQEAVPKPAVDSRLQELRAQRAALEAEVQPEVLEEQRLRVKQEREELQALDLLRKEREKQLRELETVTQHRERMALEKAKEEREMRILRRDNFLRVLRNKLEHYVTQSKHLVLRRMAWYWAGCKEKEMRLTAKIRFRALSREFRVWVGNVRELRAEREAEEQRIAEEAEKIRLQEAEKHYQFRRLWLCWKEWLNMTVENRRNREEELEAEKRRRKIAQLFEQMQQRRPPDFPMIPPSETYPREQLPETASETSQPVAVPPTRETSEQSVGPETSLESSSVQTDLEIPAFVPISTPILEAGEESLPTIISPSPLPSASPLPSPALGVKKPKASKQILAMQQREEERRIKREQLEQKYKEKEERERQKKLEAEQKAIEEEVRRKKEAAEKRRSEQQRKKEIEAKKREEAARSEELTAVAEAYRLRSLKKYALLQPWKLAVERAWRLEQRCIAQGEWVCRRLGFRLLVMAVETSKAEKEEEERRKIDLAEALYRRNLAIWLLEVLRSGLEMEKEEQAGYTQHHSAYILTHSFRLWHIITPQLQTDNDLRRARETAIIRNFQVVRTKQRLLGPEWLQSWRNGVAEARDERFKKQHEAEMWAKVQQWLAQDSHLDTSD